MIENLKITRADETTVANKLSVSYVDDERADQRGTQVAGPLNIRSKNEVNLQIPVRMSATDAKRLADVLLGTSLAERTSVTFSLPISYLKVEPTDVITLIGEDGSSYKVRVVEANLNGMVINCKGMFETDSYTSNATGETSKEPPPSLTLAQPTVPFLFDVPALRLQEGATPSLYAAMRNSSTVFNGAILYFTEGGITLEFGSASSLSTFGTVVSGVLLDWKSAGDYDGTSSIDVTVFNGELYSATLEEVLQDRYKNLAIIGSANSGTGKNSISRYELVQFVNAVLISPKTYRLTGFLRGRLGTEQNMSKLVLGGETQFTPHETSDTFCLVNTSLAVVPAANATKIAPTNGIDATTTPEIFSGGVVEMKAITVGTTAARSASSNTLEATVRPRPVVNLTAVTTTDAVVFNFDFRTVHNVNFFNSVEQDTTVAIAIRTGSVYGTIVGWVRGSSTSVVYTKTQQQADGVSSGVSLYATAYTVRNGINSYPTSIQFTTS